MDAPPLCPKTRLAGRYEIREVLGTGGMARVYRARDLERGGDVALKLLPPSAPAELRERFSREVRNARRLDHPGCIRISDSGREKDGARFFAMELLEGPTLRDELAEGVFAPRRAMAIARELLEALAHAHAAGLLHRDIKAENVMFRGVGDARRAVLIDFGLSEISGEAKLTKTGSCVGSPSYLAPERILGAPYDARADLYAVAVLLYEMVSGERPFKADSPLETARLHLEREPPPLASRCPGVPPALATTCARALRKRPEERFATAEDMAAALASPAPRASESGAGRSAPARLPWWRRALATLGIGRPPPALEPSGALSL